MIKPLSGMSQLEELLSCSQLIRTDFLKNCIDLLTRNVGTKFLLYAARPRKAMTLTAPWRKALCSNNLSMNEQSQK